MPRTGHPAAAARGNLRSCPRRPTPGPAVADLFGLVAFGELLAFDRMAADARLAPDLRRRAALSEMAAAEIANYRRLADRLTALGVAAEAAMAPYVEPLQAYHDSTEPRDWAEAVTKAYVGDAITDDFVRGDRRRAWTSPTGPYVLDVLHDSRYADFAADGDPGRRSTPTRGGRSALDVGVGGWSARRCPRLAAVAAAERAALIALIGQGDRVDVPGVVRAADRGAHRADGGRRARTTEPPAASMTPACGRWRDADLPRRPDQVSGR